MIVTHTVLGRARASLMLGLALWLFVTAPEAVPASYTGYPGPRRPVSLRLPDHVPHDGYGLVDAFPGITFSQPVALTAPPGETDRLFVVERRGTIQILSKLTRPTQSLFLDLSAQIAPGGDEGGLLGLAFHPGFATNRLFFVFLTRYQSTPGSANRFHNVVLRFEASRENSWVARPESETTILAQADDSDQHNGGDLAFGRDGYLYVSMGERVNRDISWPDQTPIDRDLQGAILRIDVDRRPENLRPNFHPSATDEYRVPADNPFIGAVEHHGRPVDPAQVRTELYAIGFRNPWRIAFDPDTGDLYAADVGESRREEINLVEPGGDYGWPYFEGQLPHHYLRPPVFNPRPPTHDYAHGWTSDGTNGNCVIGGVVYRGASMPWLHGRYLFTDFFSGNIWALSRQGTATQVERLVGTTIGPSAFGVDPRDGEVLLLQLFEGRILRLIHRAPDPASRLPASLADTGLFEDLASLRPVAGLVPFAVNAPLWSDHAIKTRWFCLPETNKMFGFNRLGNWTFPTGAVWVKHFEMEMTNGEPASMRRLETRVLVSAVDGYYGATYRWDASATNAFLVPEEGASEPLRIHSSTGDLLREQTWHFPSRSDCMNCHTEWGGRALGFTTRQLNRPSTVDPDTNQVRALAAAGYLQAAPAASDALPWLARWDDPAAPIEFRARSYLQANCVSCHVPGGSGWRTWDARIATPLNAAGIVSEPGVLIPGDVTSSKLHQRLLGYPHLMPPIGTSVIHSNAAALFANWITHYPPKPWAHGTVGDALHHGGSTVSNGVFHVGGAGRSVTNTADSFHFLHQPFDAPAAQFILRQTSQADTVGGRSGLMIREGDGTGASERFTFGSLDRNRTLWSHRRNERGSTPASQPIRAGTLPLWWRAVRQGDVISLFQSADGRDWVPLDNETWTARGPIRIGPAVDSGSDTEFGQATFDSASSLAVSLTTPGPSLVRQPATVVLEPAVESSGRGVDRIELYDGGELIADLPPHAPPFAVSNLWAGAHSFTARAIDVAGTSLSSQPLPILVEPYPTTAGAPVEDRKANGDWPGAFGSAGYAIAGFQTNLPGYAAFILPDAVAGTTIWSAATGDHRALKRPGVQSRIAAAWTSDSALNARLELRDGDLRRISLYFLDWDTANQRSQRLDILDPATGRSVRTHTIANFSRGVYVTFAMRGTAVLRLTPVTGRGAVLSAVFLDDINITPPRISLVSPTNGQTFRLPAPIPARVELADTGGGIDRVEYYLDGKLAAARDQSPFDWELDRPMEGTHVLHARAYDLLGEYGDSTPVTFVAALPTATAAFLEEDEATAGNWTYRYGSEGYLLPVQTNWPAALPVRILDGLAWFLATGPDPNYLEWPDNDTRTFSFYYADKALTADIHLADGRPRTVAAYFHDGSLYPQTVRVLDSANRKVLDTRTITNGQGGRYLVWSLQGHVSIEVTNPAPGIQARLNGLFLGPFSSAPPQVSLLDPNADIERPVPATIRLTAVASSPDGVRAIEFHTESERLGAAVQEPYEILWEFPPAGEYQVFARAITGAGAVADSPPVRVRVTPGTETTQVRFVRMDEVTLGNWQPGYGNEGYWLAGDGDAQNIPAPIRIVQTEPNASFGFTDDPAALLWPGTRLRKLAVWIGAEAWRFRVGTIDGRAHRVSIYNYAPSWDNPVSVFLREAGTSTILDTRTIESQERGTYLTWDIQGDAEFEFVTPGSFSFLNGIFIDPTPDPYHDWERSRFTVNDRLNPAVIDVAADPDLDGYNNWAEFLLNRDPTRTDGTPSFHLTRDSNGTFLHVFVNRTAPSNSVNIVSSPNLRDWDSVSDIVLEATVDRPDHVERIYRVPGTGTPGRFLRLRFESPER